MRMGRGEDYVERLRGGDVLVDGEEGGGRMREELGGIGEENGWVLEVDGEK